MKKEENEDNKAEENPTTPTNEGKKKKRAPAAANKKPRAKKKKTEKFYDIETLDISKVTDETEVKKVLSELGQKVTEIDKGIVRLNMQRSHYLELLLKLKQKAGNLGDDFSEIHEDKKVEQAIKCENKLWDYASNHAIEEPVKLGETAEDNNNEMEEDESMTPLDDIIGDFNESGKDNKNDQKVPYDKWSIVELKKEIQKRGLKVGSKKSMIAQLEANSGFASATRTNDKNVCVGSK